MVIAVIGGTGTAGRHVVERLRAAGRPVRSLSRADGVDLHTGAGLTAALDGATAVIDTSNPFPADPGSNLHLVFTTAMHNVVDASRAAGVGHVVYTSIVNIDQPAFVDFPYYTAKWAQEQVLNASGVSHSIIRSTQWFEFAMNPAAVTMADDHVAVQAWRIQPIAVATVADALIDAVRSRPERRSLAGPDALSLPELTAAYLRHRGDPRPVRAVAAHDPRLEQGMLLPDRDAERLGPDLAQWLSTQ